MTSLAEQLRKLREEREKDKDKQKEAAKIHEELPTLGKGKTTAVIIPKHRKRKS